MLDWYNFGMSGFLQLIKELNMAITDKYLINPDVELYAADNKIVTTAPCVHKDGAPDADLDCPYDGTYCRQKECRLIKWKRAVEYHATHKIDNLIVTGANMFEGCPLGSRERYCIRKIRYEKMIQELRHHVK